MLVALRRTSQTYQLLTPTPEPSSKSPSVCVNVIIGPCNMLLLWNFLQYEINYVIVIVFSKGPCLIVYTNIMQCLTKDKNCLVQRTRKNSHKGTHYPIWKWHRSNKINYILIYFQNYQFQVRITTCLFTYVLQTFIYLKNHMTKTWNSKFSLTLKY